MSSSLVNHRKVGISYASPPNLNTCPQPYPICRKVGNDIAEMIGGTERKRECAINCTKTFLAASGSPPSIRAVGVIFRLKFIP